MMLVEETVVPDAVLPVAALRAHLRMATGFAETAETDGFLAGLLRAALAAVEARTGKVVLERVFVLTLEGWRRVDAVALPVAPVAEVLGFAVAERAGPLEAVDAGRWWLERDAQRPRVRATGAALPAIPVGGRAELRFRAGMAAGWDGVPADLRQAVMLLAARSFERRFDEGGAAALPEAVAGLIAPWRVLRTFGGLA